MADLKKVELKSIYEIDDVYEILFELLMDRESHQNISHKVIPTMDEHIRFVDSKPYKSWELIIDSGKNIGSVYVTGMNEIGLFLFKKYRSQGYGKLVLEMILERHKGERMLANINPNNTASKAFFKNYGFHMIQETYSNEKRTT